MSRGHHATARAGADGHYDEDWPTRQGFRPVVLDHDGVMYEPPGEVGCSGAPEDEVTPLVTQTAHCRRQPTMVELQVIGEFVEKPGHLLLVGDDGRFYAYDTGTTGIRGMDDGETWWADLIENTSIIVDATSTVFARPRRWQADL